MVPCDLRRVGALQPCVVTAASLSLLPRCHCCLAVAAASLRCRLVQYARPPRAPRILHVPLCATRLSGSREKSSTLTARQATIKVERDKPLSKTRPCPVKGEVRRTPCDATELTGRDGTDVPCDSTELMGRRWGDGTDGSRRALLPGVPLVDAHCCA